MPPGDPQTTDAWVALLLQEWSQIENLQRYGPASLLDNDVKKRQGRRTGAQGHWTANKGFALLDQHRDLNLFGVDLCYWLLMFYHVSDLFQYLSTFLCFGVPSSHHNCWKLRFKFRWLNSPTPFSPALLLAHLIHLVLYHLSLSLPLCQPCLFSLFLSLYFSFSPPVLTPLFLVFWRLLSISCTFSLPLFRQCFTLASAVC